jgi:hypothetical protein
MRHVLPTILVCTLAGCPTPNDPDPEPIRMEDSATLCLRAGALTASFDTCGSSCATIHEATCTIDGSDVLSTVYDYTPPGDVDCTADCSIVEADCGSPSGDTVTYAGSAVDVSSLPDCDSLF